MDGGPGNGDSVEPGENGLARLERRLDGAIDRTGYGLSFYASIDDVRVRAVRSHQVFAQVAAVVRHLQALSDHAEQMLSLLGPHGRWIPETEDERARNLRIDGHVTDGLRSAGSGLDALAGLAVLLLGLPCDPKRADSRHLLQLPALPASAPSVQREHRETFSQKFSAAASAAGPNGWLAWAVEARNALVHRGHLMSQWLPTSSNHRLCIVSRSPAHKLIRFEPYLRSDFDRTEGERLVSGVDLEGVVLTEPAARTLSGLRAAVGVIAEAAAEALLTVLDDASGFMWPIAKWELRERNARESAAAAFAGFALDAERPTMSAMALNPVDVRRMEFVERARRLGER